LRRGSGHNRSDGSKAGLELTLTTKLYSATGALALVGILVAGAWIGSLQALGKELRAATDQTAVKLDLVNASRARAWEMVAALRGLYLFANLNDQKEFDATAKRFTAVFKRSAERVAEVRPLLTTAQSRADWRVTTRAGSNSGRPPPNTNSPAETASSINWLIFCPRYKRSQISPTKPLTG
jgi:hypothetical protein